MTITLDGEEGGRYRGLCECGFGWESRARLHLSVSYSHALPIAEASVHHRMCHGAERMDLQFTHPFELWLEEIWKANDAFNGLGYVTRRR